VDINGRLAAKINTAAVSMYQQIHSSLAVSATWRISTTTTTV